LNGMANANDNGGANGRGNGSPSSPGSGGGPKGPIKDTLRAPLPRRFYTGVDLREGAAGGFEILLDGRPVRTPLKRVLVVSDAAFAARVMEEWSAQKSVIDPATMPATRLANSAIDTVADNRAAVAAEVVAYAATDLVCYRAERPQSLVDRQCEVWNPILAAIEADLGVQFTLAQGIVHRAQSEAVLRAVGSAIGELPNLVLGALQLVTTLTGSAVLALALYRGYATADDVWAAAHVDDDWQIAQWGPDEEAQARRAAHERDYRAAAAALATSH
jgi:chaperone required for assembly of F1-ATPase